MRRVLSHNQLAFDNSLGSCMSAWWPDQKMFLVADLFIPTTVHMSMIVELSFLHSSDHIRNGLDILSLSWWKFLHA